MSIEKVAEPTLDAIVDALADGEFCAGVGEGCPEVVDFVIRYLSSENGGKLDTVSLVLKAPGIY